MDYSHIAIISAIENIVVNGTWIEIMIVLTMLPIAMRARLQNRMAMSMVVMVVGECSQELGVSPRYHVRG